MHGWQANIERTCAQPVKGRAMPENEIPPAMRVDIYLNMLFCLWKNHKKELLFAENPIGTVI